MLAFDTDEVLDRVAGDGDLFGMLVSTTQELPGG
jgi:hypothetical protein